MNKQQLLLDIKTQLENLTPQWYAEISAICAPQFNGHTQWQPMLHFQHPFGDFVDYINHGLISEERFIDGICNCIHFSFQQSFGYAFLRMQPKRDSLSYNQVPNAINEWLQRNQGTPLIVNFGVDMYGLDQNQGWTLNQQTNSWSYRGIGINEFPIQSIPRELDRSFIIVTKEDAPYVDFAKNKYMSLFSGLPEAVLTNDANNTWEILTQMRQIGENQYDEYFFIKNVIPILCKTGTNIYQIYVNKYTYETKS